MTFSVSVDVPTRKLLRDAAARSHRGNVSELISHLARQAARQEALAEFLAMHDRSPMDDREADAFERQIAAELASQRPSSKRRRSAG